MLPSSLTESAASAQIVTSSFKCKKKKEKKEGKKEVLQK